MSLQHPDQADVAPSFAPTPQPVSLAHTSKRRRAKSAGGILIDPWNSCGNVADVGTYRVLIVNQRVGKYWGLPKGHVEERDHDIYDSALRELREETGIDLQRLRRGVDYAPVRLRDTKRFFNHIVIKKIHFFAFVLLRRVHGMPRAAWDAHEIQDTEWISLDDLARKTQRHDVRCNRTLSQVSLQALHSVCQRAQNVVQSLICNGSGEAVEATGSMVIEAADEDVEAADVVGPEEGSNGKDHT